MAWPTTIRRSPAAAAPAPAGSGSPPPAPPGCSAPSRTSCRPARCRSWRAAPVPTMSPMGKSRFRRGHRERRRRRDARPRPGTDRPAWSPDRTAPARPDSRPARSRRRADTSTWSRSPARSRTYTSSRPDWSDTNEIQRPSGDTPTNCSLNRLATSGSQRPLARVPDDGGVGARSALRRVRPRRVPPEVGRGGDQRAAVPEPHAGVRQGGEASSVSGASALPGRLRSSSSSHARPAGSPARCR